MKEGERSLTVLEAVNSLSALSYSISTGLDFFGRPGCLWPSECLDLIGVLGTPEFCPEDGALPILGVHERSRSESSVKGSPDQAFHPSR
jgi:hypothetical protein